MSMFFRYIGYNFHVYVCVCVCNFFKVESNVLLVFSPDFINFFSFLLFTSIYCFGIWFLAFLKP